MTTPVFPVILCGGSGTRLWPLSRAMYPKQFIPLLNGSDESLLASTLQRLAPGLGFAAPTLLCNNDHRFLLRDELERAGVEPREILLEPVARNTAPAIAVAALSIVEQSPEAILAVMPSDHVVRDVSGFADAVSRAGRIASQGNLVLFGVRPQVPHTGYGYIRMGQSLGGAEDEGCHVAAFVEKPDLPTAERYLSEGGYFWNSGIFVLPAAIFLEELTRFAPEIVEHARAALGGAECDLGFRRLDGAAYAQCPNISIDYALMEKTSKAAMLPLDVSWSDLGSWRSIWEVAPHDADGNVVSGDAMLVDTRNSYVHSQGALVSALGVEDMIIIQTQDAMLVTKQDRAQDVGKLVAQLKLSNRREHEQHVRNYRPWGFFETLSLGPRFQVKLLHVKPGAQLSLQMHHHRSEHWVVVSGTARVTCDAEKKLVSENESVYISATQWHQLENPGKVPLEIIEVQLGSYLGEDDIVRKDDIYHRGSHETK
jgi:mannose-1-phosphate guanylyltransferase/mannose-6-phosphate isomerase